MILSQTAEYALRVMTAIALTRGAQPLKAKEIATQINCPAHYISKVLRKLVKSGLLRAEKGHGGGFRLARSAQQILFCHVLEAVEGSPQQKHCIFGWRQCNANNPCILHNRWSTVSETFLDWTKKTSLLDIQNDASNSDWLISNGASAQSKFKK